MKNTEGEQMIDSNREFMLDRIKQSYLALNIYNESSFLDCIVEVLLLEDLELNLRNLNELKYVHLLKYYENENLIQNIEKVLFYLLKSTKHEVKIMNGKIEGNIDWGLTYKERLKKGNVDLSVFVTKPKVSIYNNMPNILYKYILEHLLSLIDEYGVYGFQKEYIENLQSTIKKVLNHSRLKNIIVPKKIDSKILNSIKNHKNPHYRRFYQFAKIYYKLYIINDKNELFKVIKAQLLAPKKDDKIYEYYVLFELLNVLEQKRIEESGTKSLKLLKAGEATYFKYDLNNFKIKIHYQHTPDRFKEVSKYKRLLKEYGYNDTVSIPDVVIEIEKGNKYIGAIIEVKYSDSRAYLGEGIQDAQSYLEDFKEVLIKNSKVLLAIWEDTPKAPINIYDQPLIISGHKMLNERINGFLNALLNDNEIEIG